MEAFTEVASILAEAIKLLAVEGWLMFAVIRVCEAMNGRER